MTGGAENSVFTVTYTPKKNMAYLDQYYKKEGFIEYPKWNKEHLSFNGPDVLDNNRYEKAYLIQGGHLTELLESARFLDVDGTIYDFTAAKQLPSDLKVVLIDKVWYDREDAKWYYTSTAAPNRPVPFTSIVNLYYGEKHDTDSEYHDFVATTVDPTCTEGGYTDYECRYCGKTKRDDFIGPLDHDWGTYVHVDGTEKENSQHYQVCKRKGCNATSTPVDCNFVDTSIETGTRHTCKDCGYYYDESAPKTTPVYVYFKTVHHQDGNVKVNDGVTYNNNTGNNNTGEKWATLGKLTTTADVATANAADIGKEVKDVNDDPNTNFERYKVNGNVINGNVGISLIDWKSIALEPNGAADYVGFGTEAWHLNGQVNVYKLSYDANLPTGVAEEAVTGMPDSAYYLPDWEATVSTADPTLQGYVFGGWYTEETCEHKVEKTVTVSEDTVLYAKWTPAQPITADLIDNAITIYHKVSGQSEWHGGNAYADASAHPAGRTPTISYKAELDLSKMELQTNIRTASIIAAYGEKPWENLVEAVKTARGSLAMFSGSKIVLHVQLDKQLSTADIQKQLNKITVTSDWFELSKAGNPVVYDENAQSLTITCVPKIKADGYRSTITLSGLNDLSLTSILSSGETRTLTASGYITGSILISVPTVKVNAVTVETEDLVDAVQHGNGELYLNESIPLVLGSKTATNTAKLYWKEIKDNDDDDDDKYFFAIQKVDAQDGHALNGAVFELYQRDRRDNKLPASRKTTAHWGTESGIALFSVSATKTNEGGDTWYYREITAPEGYVLDTKEYEISARDFYHDDQSNAVAKAKTVRNYRGTTPDLLNDSDHFAYVIGYMDGNVRPYGLISRAETTTIFFRLLKDSVRDGNLLTSNTYTDVADDYWANTAISTMTGLGIVQGRSTTTFDPKAPITRAQFAAICARFDTGKSSGTQSFTDIKGHWAEKYIERAAELGWIKGFEDGTFRPDTYITRAQAMTMINRVLNRIPEDESDLLAGMNTWPDCNPGDWFYLAVQEATNSHDFEHKAGNYETWTKLMKNPDWTRYEN
ncbi:MAG: S-layer homology domain-containing protein [Dysosmobacter sp.]